MHGNHRAVKQCADVLQRFLRDERGATAVEYGLIALGIAVAIIGTVMELGEEVLLLYELVRDAFPG